MKFRKFFTGYGIALIALFACVNLFATELPRSESPPGAKVYFIAPQDGAVVSNPVKIVFGLTGMGVAPAGTEKDSTGHHHLLIDVEEIDFSMPIGKDEHHRHFGGGQTEATIELPAGEHTLQLLLADHLHIPHDPPVISEKITISVQ